MTKNRRILAVLAAMWIAAGACVILTIQTFRTGLGAPAEVTSRSAYVLRETGGYVAVYTVDRPGTPVEITDIAVRDLRAQDQALLRAGLGADDRESLLMLLEDLKA